MGSKVKRCSLDFQPMEGCGRALSDLGLSTNALAFVIGALDTAFTCVINVHCDKCKALQANIRCLSETWEFCNATTRGQHSRETGALAKALLSATRIDRFLHLVSHIFGNDEIFNLKESAWFEKFKKSVWDSSDGGLLVTSKEYHTILNSAKISTQRVLTNFLHRWNNTVSAWEGGTLTTLASDDVMAYDIVQSGWRTYHTETKAVKQSGYTSIFDQFDATLKIHLWESKQKLEEGCTTAAVEVEKSDVRVGEEVRVKVKLDNTAGPVMQNIKLELDFQAMHKHETVEQNCFSIGKPSLSGIMGVDGTGRLAAGVVASADWIIVPLNCSAALGKNLVLCWLQNDLSGSRRGFSARIIPKLHDHCASRKCHPALILRFKSFP
ncbi:uncharacterized protein LOC135464102 [Liolophura sinensis]|uniref:uncharacterized protein LOC135464102 n=1 Tax=Liolophura sinensis TaxID=3198878 RepID=UPI003158DF01